MQSDAAGESEQEALSGTAQGREADQAFAPTRNENWNVNEGDFNQCVIHRLN
jgi:hypothetical protein